MIESAVHSRPDRLSDALLFLGMTIPVFAGGNSFPFLDDRTGMSLFLLATLIAAAGIRGARGTGAPSSSTKIALACAAVLCTWWAGSFAFRPAGPRSGFELEGILCGMLAFWLLSTVDGSADATRSLVRGLLIGSAVTALFAQYQAWIAFPRTLPELRRLGITPSLLPNANFYNANSYALFLAAVTLLGGCQAIRERDRVAMLLLPFVVVALAETQSRSTIALLLVMLLVALILTGWRPRSSRVAVEAAWILVPAAAGAAAGSIDFEELWHVGALGRVAIWHASLRMIADHWATGVGLGGFGDWFPRYRLNNYYTRYPHSFLLEIGAELGVVGLVATVGFLSAALRAPVRRVIHAARSHAMGDDQGALLAIIAAAALMILHALVDIDWHAPANPILLFVLLGLAQRLGLGDDERQAG